MHRGLPWYALVVFCALLAAAAVCAQESPSPEASTERAAEEIEASLEELDDLRGESSALEAAGTAEAEVAVDEIMRLADSGSSGSGDSPGEAGLDEAIARLETSIRQLDALEAKALELDAAESREAAAAMEKIKALESQLAAAERGSPEVERIYDRVVPLVHLGLDQVSEAMDRSSQPARLPAYLEKLDLVGRQPKPFGGLSAGPPTEQMAKVQQLETEIRRKIERLETLEIELRIASVERHVAVAGRLYRLRLATLPMLPLDRRRAIASIAQEGQDAIRLELRTAKEIWRLRQFRIRGALAALAANVRTLFTAVVAGWLLVRLTIVILVWRWLRSGRRGLLRSLRRKALSISDPVRQRWVVRLNEFLASLVPWGTFLLGLAGLRWVFGPPVFEVPLLFASLGLAATYGGYRLLVDLSVGAVKSAAESTGLELTESLADRLHRAVRWVMRALAAVLFLLWLIQLRLGKGVLYARLQWIGGMVVLLVLLFVVLRWRRPVAQMYLALKAEGWLANLLRGSDRRLVVLLVTPLAFLWLCWNGFVSVLRGLAFSFERTRSAVAYMTRKRIDRVAEQRGYASGKVDELPAAVVEALDPDLSSEDMERADRFTDLARAEAAARAWAEGGIGSSILLAAETGLGKSCWLDRFAGAVGGATRMTIEDRLLSPVKLRAFLQQGLLPDVEGVLDRDGLVEALNGGSRRVVMIQRAENLFLGTVNGYRSLDELGPIIDATRNRIFWLLTMGGIAWDHLNASGKELSFLRRKVVLETWSPQEVQDLIEHRLQRTGLEVSYAGLMAVEGRKEDEASRNRVGRQAYLHLLFEHSGGNPQIALYFLLRSLQVGERGRLEVRPFRTPSEEDLVGLGYDSLFLLAAVVRHGSLAARQAATTTDFAIGKVEGLFLQLLDLGAVEVTNGSYRVTIGWRASVLRVLRRSNILTA